MQIIIELNHQRKGGEIMKAFLTVIGKDKVGIVAAISDELAKLNVNIIDITQTIMEDFFTMVVMVDLEKSPKSFDEIKDALKYGYGIRILRQDIFEMFVSFVISANNNIPRIKNSIKYLREHAGKNMGSFHAFPTLTELA